MAGQVRVLMDVPEPRPWKGRLAVGADGSNWDMSNSVNMWIDPCTSTAMLKPLPLTSAWKTTFTGNYARYGLSDFTGTDISKWEQYGINKSALDKALSMKQTTANPINLTTPLPINCPMYLKYYRATTQDSTDDAFLVVGYNVGAGGSAPSNFSVQVKFKENGSISIFRDGVLEADYDRSGTNFAGNRTYTSTFNPANKYVNVLLIPFRGRDLLVWTDNGTCLSHTFKDYDYPNDDVAKPILPAGTFSITVPNGKCSVQVARCYFHQSGTLYSYPKTLRYAPEASDWTTVKKQWYAEYFGQGAAYPDASAPSIVRDVAGFPTFTANGVNRQVRLKLPITGGSGGTNIGIYCADCWVDPPYSATYDATVDVTTAIESLSIKVGEDGRGTLEMTSRAKRLIDLGVSQPTITGDRPVAIQIKSDNPSKQWVDIFRGTLSAPRIEYLVGDVTPNMATLTFSGEDRYGDFDALMFPEAVPLDYSQIGPVLDNIMPMAGYDPAIYLTQDHSSTMTTPYSPDISKSIYSLIPKRGDYIGGFIQQFRDEYLADWFIGWKPTPDATPTGGYKFWIADPSYLSTTPVVTLWQSTYDAIGYGSLTAVQSIKRTIRRMTRYFEEPECNQVAVIGADPKTNRLLYSYAIDSGSQNPTTAPAARPQNWRGRPIQYILADQSLTNQYAVNASTTLLYNRLTTGRQLLEVETDFLYWLDGTNHINIVWIGDVIEVMTSSDKYNPGVPPDTLGTYRVLSLDITFKKESTNDTSLKLRSATYKGVYVPVT